MPAVSSNRTIYGPHKYAAFHLLLARWLYVTPHPTPKVYVTLGGSELRDIRSLAFISKDLVNSVFSYESDPERFIFAATAVADLAAQNITVNLRGEDLFTFKRKASDPHLFFVDLEGTCAFGDLHLQFGKMFQSEVIKNGDTLFITSYLGRNKGWDELEKDFDSEFRILGLSKLEDKKSSYRKAHPSFTLFKGLESQNLQDELHIRCIGCVKYRDTSAMAIYGYHIGEGRTSFRSFVENTPFYCINTGQDHP